MTAFELVEPSSLGEALRLLDSNDPGVRPIAGGTALMLMMKTGFYRPRCLVNLRALGPALTTIAATPDGGLDVLRDRFALDGPRESCGQGLCGCCTVLVDNAAVSGCLYLAVFADGAEIVTIEGLADGDTLHPVQEAFIEAGAFQCGFTPRIRADDDAAIGGASRPERRPDPSLPVGQSVPLRHLSADRRSGQVGGAETAGRMTPFVLSSRCQASG